MIEELVITALVLLIAVSIGGGVLLISPQVYRWSQVRGWRRNRTKIALTYDDGPDDVTSVALLDLLDELGVKATFYLVGFRAERHPAVVRRIHESGHEVGSHSHLHRHAWKVWPWAETRDARRGHETIAQIMGAVPGCYRPPFGKIALPNFLALRRRNTRIDWWTDPTNDTWEPLGDPQRVAADLADTGGRVVLMHCHHSEPERRRYMLDVTRALVAEARSRGLELVTMAAFNR